MPHKDYETYVSAVQPQADEILRVWQETQELPEGSPARREKETQCALAEYQLGQVLQRDFPVRAKDTLWTSEKDPNERVEDSVSGRQIKRSDEYSRLLGMATTVEQTTGVYPGWASESGEALREQVERFSHDQTASLTRLELLMHWIEEPCEKVT